MRLTMTNVPPTAAERMRSYRKRRRQGLRYVRIQLCIEEIDALIRMGRVKDDFVTCNGLRLRASDQLA